MSRAHLSVICRASKVKADFQQLGTSEWKISGQRAVSRAGLVFLSHTYNTSRLEDSSSHGCAAKRPANSLAVYHAQRIFHTRRLLRRRCSRRRRRCDRRLLPQTHPRHTPTTRPRPRPKGRRETINVHRRRHHARTVRGTQVWAPRWVSESSARERDASQSA